MRTSILLATVLSLAFASKTKPQDARSAAHASAAELVVKLKAEAARLGSGHASDTFAYLDRSDEGGIILSTEQRGLVRRLDEVTRAVLCDWLLRGLDVQPLPPVDALAERLGEQANRHRQAVIAHAESMALEAILAPAQVRRLPRAFHKSKPLAGRYGQLPSANDKPPQTAIDVELGLRSLAQKLDDPKFPSSELFGIIIDREKGPTGLPAERIELARRLDDLSRMICRDWLLRNLGKPHPLGAEPPNTDMLDRLWRSEGRLRASIVAHAELIVLSAVLDPQQAEQTMRLFWHQRGIKALLDPELARRLRLSGEQQEEIFDRIIERNKTVHDAVGAVAVYEAGAMSADFSAAPNRNEAARAAKQAFDRAQIISAEADALVLESLTVPQMRLFSRLTGKSTPSRPASKTE
jgi:hypothetical protein